MWTTLTYGFLYVFTNMVWSTNSIQTVTNSPLGTAADWVTNCNALISRALATKTGTNGLSLTNQTVVRITWENNAGATYEWTAVTNWGSTNTTGTNVCSTNLFSTNFLYGKQLYSIVSRYGESSGFETASTNTAWFRLANYVVSPLLWGGGMYVSSALTSTVPTVLGPYQVAGQVGRYIYDWETNAWPYYETNIVDGVTNITIKVPEFNTNNVISNQSGVIIGEVTNLPFTFTTSRLDVVFLDYNPTDQRPNAITPLMGRGHVLAMDAKLQELIPKYYNDTVAAGESFNSYCATAGVYWVSNYYVGAIWFEMDKVLSATTSRYTTTLPVPNGVVVSTNIISATSNLYDFVTNTRPEVAGSAGDYDRTTTNPPYSNLTGSPGYTGTVEESISVGGWVTRTRETTVPPGAGTITRTTIVTNLLSGGAEGSVEDYNGTKTTTSSVPASTYASNIVSGTGVSGAGLAGEIDYHYVEIAGSVDDYTRRVALSTNLVSSSPYSFLTTSNHTQNSTVDHFNRTTPRVRNDRVYIWAGVSNLLAQYMTPWVVDHTNNSTVGNTNYYDQYLFNYGWSPFYNTGWRLYSEAISAWGTNYFWDWTTTNLYLINYQYFKANTNESAPPFHYPRSYSYYWKYPTEVITTDYCNESYQYWGPVHAMQTRYWYPGATNYFKTVDNFVYTKNQFVYGIDEPRYTIKYQVFPSGPPLYTLPSFLTAHSNTLGNANWLLNPFYLCETQAVLSNVVMSVTNDGVVDSWTNYYTTNTVITNPAVYGTNWAISLWGDSFNQRYKATTALQWTSYGAYIESETRTIGWVTSTVAWATTAVTTNSTGSGTYNSSIQGLGYWTWPTFYYIYSATRVRTKRIAGAVLDGPIDVYMKFGTTLSGRYDLGSLGYPFGPYVKVSELSLAAGEQVSGWLGSIATVPTYPNLAAFAWQHPWGFKIQNTSSAGVFVFKPVFTP